MKNLISLSLAAMIAVPAAPAAESVKTKPNVVLIYGDDVGFADVGVYGSTLIPTPNIDRLAREGLRFTDGHATSATCTPSRFAMLTGVHAFRGNVNILPPNAPLIIPENSLTLPEVFRKAGYHTGIVGKWHLGLGRKGGTLDWNRDIKPGPLEVGFDYAFLLPSTNDRVPCVYVENHRVVNLDPADPLFIGTSKEAVDRPGSTSYPDGKTDRAAMTYYQSTHGHDNSVINGIGRIGYQAGGKSALWDDEMMADEFVARARQYIEQQKDGPFFLFFSSQDIHVPRTPHPRFHGATTLGYRGDAMVQFDWSTGEIMKMLEEFGLTENTIVIFSSDNGPVYDDGYDDGTTVKPMSAESDGGHDASGIWRGGKYQIFEGGTRVPFIIRWPSRIEPGVSDAMVSQIDFLASFAALLGVTIPEGEALDSRDTLEAFLGNDPVGLPFLIQEAMQRIALRRGEWKYIPAINPGLGQSPRGGAGPEAALFNLAADPSETKNVIDTHPEIARSMEDQLNNLKSAKGIRE